MIITQLKIKSFGKLNNLNIEFGDKLNVVYGPNEAGKTTILAFIKAMLYGMTSRKRDIRENDRLRFQPWHGDFGAGELYFKDENKSEFVIRRNLGNVRRDNLQVTSVQTGQRIPEYERNNPGEAILGLGEAAFMRTIYVPQLGCTVSPDKDDEIMARLHRQYLISDPSGISLKCFLISWEYDGSIPSEKGKLIYIDSLTLSDFLPK
jgi:exonuclease SbcC